MLYALAAVVASTSLNLVSIFGPRASSTDPTVEVVALKGAIRSCTVFHGQTLMVKQTSIRPR